MTRKNRTSNLELLRIAAMLMIIALHQNGMANALAALAPHARNIDKWLDKLPIKCYCID